MIAVDQTVKCLYEQILNLHEFVDPNISKQFYLNRLEDFNQLPLLLEDMLFMFTNVSSKVRELVLTVKPQRLYTVSKLSSSSNLPEEIVSAEIHTEPDLKKKLTINSMGFGENNVLRERSINTKPARKQRQSVEVSKQHKENRNKQLKDIRNFQDMRESRQKMTPHRLVTTVDKEKERYWKHSITENDQHSQAREKIPKEKDPYGDQLIYMQNIQLNTLRDTKKDHPRKRKILSISVKNQNSPNMFVS